jgi:hypothetical protein
MVSTIGLIKASDKEIILKLDTRVRTFLQQEPPPDEKLTWEKCSQLKKLIDETASIYVEDMKMPFPRLFNPSKRNEKGVLCERKCILLAISQQEYNCLKKTIQCLTPPSKAKM